MNRSIARAPPLDDDDTVVTIVSPKAPTFSFSNENQAPNASSTTTTAAKTPKNETRRKVDCRLIESLDTATITTPNSNGFNSSNHFVLADATLQCVSPDASALAAAATTTIGWTFSVDDSDDDSPIGRPVASESIGSSHQEFGVGSRNPAHMDMNGTVGRSEFGTARDQVGNYRLNRSHSSSSSSSSSEAEWDGSLDWDHGENLVAATTSGVVNQLVESLQVIDITSDSDEEQKSEEQKQRHGTYESTNVNQEIITIHDDDDDDDFDDAAFPTAKLRTAEASRKPMRPLQQPCPPPKPSSSMSKREFQANREKLTKVLLDQYLRGVFRSLQSSTHDSLTVEWSNTLRTTAGLTRLKQVLSSSTSTGSSGPDICQPIASSTASTGTGSAPPRTMVRMAVIQLSTKVLDDQQRLQSTLLHELCHAAAWIVDGYQSPPHGAGFQKWAQRAMRAALPGVPVTTTHSYEISYKYAWACTSATCSVVVGRQSRSIDIKRQVCGRCKSRLQPVDPTTHQPRSDHESRSQKQSKPPSAYNVFVKEQSKSVRQRLRQEAESRGDKGSVQQADVMKECARLWQEHKERNRRL
jgi:predicted SprT family Zn-dependent metalloprotease